MKLIFQLTPRFYNQSKHQAGSAPLGAPTMPVCAMPAPSPLAV